MSRQFPTCSQVFPRYALYIGGEARVSRGVGVGSVSRPYESLGRESGLPEQAQEGRTHGNTNQCVYACPSPPPSFLAAREHRRLISRKKRGAAEGHVERAVGCAYPVREWCPCVTIHIPVRALSALRPSCVCGVGTLCCGVRCSCERTPVLMKHCQISEMAPFNRLSSSVDSCLLSYTTAASVLQSFL